MSLLLLGVGLSGQSHWSQHSVAGATVNPHQEWTPSCCRTICGHDWFRDFCIHTISSGTRWFYLVAAPQLGPSAWELWAAQQEDVCRTHQVCWIWTLFNFFYLHWNKKTLSSTSVRFNQVTAIVKQISNHMVILSQILQTYISNHFSDRRMRQGWHQNQCVSSWAIFIAKIWNFFITSVSLMPFSFCQPPASNWHKISWINCFSVFMLYEAWKRGLPQKFAHFVLFRPIKKRSFNLLCVLDLYL